jgi:drug/metabolite transporter (DMT)-like permease
MNTPNTFNSLKRHYSGFLFAIGAAVLFSLKPILIKKMYLLGLDTNTMMALRMIFSMPFYIVVCAWVLHKNTSNLPTSSILFKTAGLGLAGYYFASYLDLWGLQFVSAQLERLLLYAYPSMVVLLTFIIYKVRPSKKIIIALIITYAGIGSLYFHDLQLNQHSITLGAGAILLSALCFACYSLFSKNLATQTGSLLFTCIAMLAAGIAMLIQFMITNPISDLLQSKEVYTLAILNAVVATVIPSFMMTEAITRIGPSQVSIVGGVGPVTTSILAVFILGEYFTVYHAIALTLVIFGVFLLIPPKRSPSSQ